jgi:hypothetical protein
MREFIFKILLKFFKFFKINIFYKFVTSFAPLNPINKFYIYFIKMIASVEVSYAPDFDWRYMKLLDHTFIVAVLNWISFDKAIRLISKIRIKEQSSFYNFSFFQRLLDQFLISPVRFIKWSRNHRFFWLANVYFLFSVSNLIILFT